jgi:hypothetical protein
MDEYDASLRNQAERDRYEKELAMGIVGSQFEVVLLESPDFQTVKKTHGRYFKTIKTLANRSVTDDAAPTSKKKGKG